ncbi:MAG TPA: TetR/AcrR family transcriptional regulator [Sphingomonas sp.]|uniref:TetR/AcrR family transcriptional regulator n=1 Tax=Sphingomonas sp. TaxID=28214 RepID=UPI002BDA7035|nr:TetR/AcrR family transcriptional regulator [Sphingomonas sp.]HMI18960.1 TetR/AcrR family transcriptional regulator [Sphingomonas sp.]
MRVRSEEKRREIVTAAAELFVKLGYEHTSMAAISERVGGSKATLYGYFVSKEDLLRAVLEYDVANEAMLVFGEFPAEGDLREGLTRLGIQYLTGRLAALPIANLRTLASLPGQSPLGKEFYDTVLGPAWEVLADHFAALMESGHLRKADPWVAAMHWKGLQEGEFLEKRLIGAISHPDPKDVKRVATLAADAFLRIYASGQAESEPTS